MWVDSSIPLNSLRADGGAAANNLLLQIQADIIQVPINRPRSVESTATGAAYLAGLAVGFWKDQEELRERWGIDRTFMPQISKEERDKMVQGWNRAVIRSFDWAR